MQALSRVSKVPCGCLLQFLHTACPTPSPPHTETQNWSVSLSLCTLRMDAGLRSSEVFFFPTSWSSRSKFLPGAGSLVWEKPPAFLIKGVFCYYTELTYRGNPVRPPDFCLSLPPPALPTVHHAHASHSSHTLPAMGLVMGRCVPRSRCGPRPGQASAPVGPCCILNGSLRFRLGRLSYGSAPPQECTLVWLSLTPRLPLSCGEADRTVEGHSQHRLSLARGVAFPVAGNAQVR